MTRIVTFSMKMKYNSVSEAIVLVQKTGTHQVWAGRKPGKEMLFYKGFSGTLTA